MQANTLKVPSRVAGARYRERAPCHRSVRPVDWFRALLVVRFAPVSAQSENKAAKWVKPALVSLLALAVAGVGFLGFAWSRLRPWLAPPSAPQAEIERRWQAVVALQPDEGPREGDALLLAAVDAQSKAAKRDCCKDLKEIPRSDLVPSERAAVSKLVEWYRQGGVVVSPLCVVEPDGEIEAARESIAIASLKLAMLALGSSFDDEDMPQVLAAWHLGQELRLHGTAIGVAVGYTIRARTVEWFAARGMSLPKRLDVSPPPPEELYGVLAREAVCEDKFLDAGPGFAFYERPKEAVDQWPPKVLVNPARERQLHRHIVGTVLARPFRSPPELRKLLVATLKKEPPSVFPAIVTRRVVEAVVDESEKLENHLKKLQ